MPGGLTPSRRRLSVEERELLAAKDAEFVSAGMYK